MTEPQLWDTVETTTFERLVAGPCPPGGEVLLAIAAEFRPVAAGTVSYRLDELARALFDVVEGGEPRDIALGLATLLTEEQRFASDESSVDGLLLDLVLARRAGHPLALSVLAAEVGRRAGVAVGVCSTPTGWYAGISGPEQLWLIDPTTDARPTPTGPVRRHCGHELAFAALTGLYARFVRDRDEARAHHASQLRSRLPVERHQC
jgi:transglutaminase superfamily protein